MTLVTAASPNFHAAEGGLIEAAKATIHSAQATPGASQFYFSIPLIGLSRLAGGGKRLTAAAVAIGTVVGTLFSNWKEVSSAYQKGSDLTGAEVMTEGVSFLGQTALMIFSGLAGAPAGKLSSLFAKNLVRRIDFRRLPLINKQLQQITQRSLQLFIAGAGVYGFAFATHLTSSGIQKGNGQENAFHDFLGQVNHLFFFMGTQQLTGLAGIGRGASSVAGKALGWCGNTIAASVAMQTVINPVVFGKKGPSSLAELWTTVGNESRDLALLHLGGKALPHQLPFLNQAMRRWDRQINEGLRETFVQIEQARIKKEARWLNDPLYRRDLVVKAGTVAAGITAGLVSQGATSTLPIVLGITKPVAGSEPASVKWPASVDTEILWKIYSEIYDKPPLRRAEFDIEMKRQTSREKLFRDLGGIYTRVTLALICHGEQYIRAYTKLFGIVSADPALEEACWKYVEDQVPEWKGIGVKPQKHFFDLVKGQAEMDALQGENAQDGVLTPELLLLNARLSIEGVVLLVAGQEAMIRSANDIGLEGETTVARQAEMNRMIARKLGQIFLRKLDCETGKYLRPQMYYDDVTRPEFLEAYKGLKIVLEREYRPGRSPEQDSLMSLSIQQHIEKLKKAKAGGTYDDLAMMRNERDAIPVLYEVHPSLIARLYLHLVTETPLEILAIERIKSFTVREMESYKEGRRKKFPQTRRELMEILATAECLADFTRSGRFTLSEGPLTGLEQVQIASLSTVVTTLHPYFTELVQTALAEKSVGKWKEYADRRDTTGRRTRVDESYILDDILNPLLQARMRIARKRRLEPPDTLAGAQLKTIEETLFVFYEEVRKLSGIRSSLN